MKNLKKVVMFALVAIISVCSWAQEQMSEEEMAQRRAQLEQMRAEKFAKELGLKDSAKSEFVAVYLEYKNALKTLQPKVDFNAQNEKEKKKLTDDEAREKVQEFMTAQQQMANLSAARLAVHQKYLAIFQKTLTPQQLAKIFVEERAPRRTQEKVNFNSNMPQRDGGRGGFPGGQPGGGPGGFPGGGMGGMGGGPF